MLNEVQILRVHIEELERKVGGIGANHIRKNRDRLTALEAQAKACAAGDERRTSRKERE